jgi:hypothetical protein
MNEFKPLQTTYISIHRKLFLEILTKAYAGSEGVSDQKKFLLLLHDLRKGEAFFGPETDEES